MSTHLWTTAPLALALAFVHAAAKHLRLSGVVPRSGWLSFGGGVSVAYVFVHVLPELGAGQVAIEEAQHALVDELAYHAYLIALAGFALFHGLERWAVRARGDDDEADTGITVRSDDDEDGSGNPVFWAHLLSYGLLNAIIGYLLVEYATSGDSALLFAVAMGFHFLINDDSLRRHHPGVYDRTGRWVLAAAVLGGWGFAAVADLTHPALMAAFAFVSGGVILNVIKEELPTDRKSRFDYFLVGAALYAGLLVVL
ncbi:hypothetical protein G9464_15620 [Halostella sp. JP-L12]|uniref:hypothetical protein n=1 Tax=Halostella TaxID=1843185 RepID=UPI000EF7E3DC|nr:MULTISPECIES: hypothetical protein [Halostella]NHN49012.1 hypothetical protein [Halostella sp. JP-L12]